MNKSILNKEWFTEENLANVYTKKRYFNSAKNILIDSELFPFSFNNPKFFDLMTFGFYNQFSGTMAEYSDNAISFSVSGGSNDFDVVKDSLESKLSLKFRLEKKNEYVLSKNRSLYFKILKELGFPYTKAEKGQRIRKSSVEKLLPYSYLEVINNYDSYKNGEQKKINGYFRLMLEVLRNCCDSYSNNSASLRLPSQPNKSIAKKQANLIIKAHKFVFPKLDINFNDSYLEDNGLYRPLIFFPKEEIIKYGQSKGLFKLVVAPVPCTDIYS